MNQPTSGRRRAKTTRARYGADQYRRIGQLGGKNSRRPKPRALAAPTGVDQAPGM